MKLLGTTTTAAFIASSLALAALVAAGAATGAGDGVARPGEEWQQQDRLLSSPTNHDPTTTTTTAATNRHDGRQLDTGTAGGDLFRFGILIINFIQKLLCNLFGIRAGCVCSEETLRAAIAEFGNGGRTIYVCYDTEIALDAEIDLTGLENLSLGCQGKPLFLGLISLPSTCTLSGGDSHRIFSGSPTALSLSGLRLEKGFSESDGGCCHFPNGTISFSNCVFDGCRTNLSGGAVRATYPRATLDFTDCQFQDCSAAGKGGGVHLYFAQGSFDRCNFDRCTADDGSGGALSTAGLLYLKDCNFRDNLALGNLGYGGALYLVNSAGPSGLTTSGTVRFERNRAKWGGAIRGGTSYLSDVVLKDNSAVEDGGAMYVEFADIDLVRGVFDGNTAGDQGNDIFILDDIDPDTYGTFVNCTTQTVFCDGVEGIFELDGGPPDPDYDNDNTNCDAVAQTSGTMCT